MMRHTREYYLLRRHGSPLTIGEHDILNPVRWEWLKGLEVQANSTAVDLDALASGNLEDTEMYYSFAQTYKDIAKKRLDFIVSYKSEFIAGSDTRTRAFVDDTGDLSAALGRATLNKSILVRVIDSHDFGAFRVLGIYDPGSDRPFFPVQDNENIILYVTGNTFRYDERVHPNELGDGRIKFDPEAWGVMYVTPDGRDPGGNFDASYDFTVDKGGRRFTLGEPKLAPLDEIKFPFIDKDKTNEVWTKENVESFKVLSYGVNWGLNPAALDEGNSQDPKYGAIYVGPHFPVFDSRKDAPTVGGDTVFPKIGTPSQ